MARSSGDRRAYLDQRVRDGISVFAQRPAAEVEVPRLHLGYYVAIAERQGSD